MFFQQHHVIHVHTMKFGSIAKVLLKCKLKYYRISECVQGHLQMSGEVWDPIICSKAAGRLLAEGDLSSVTARIISIMPSTSLVTRWLTIPGWYNL